MKPFAKFVTLALLLLLTLHACKTTKSAPLPQTRPADFEIWLSETGEKDDPSRNYSITSEESYYEDFSANESRKWVFHPSTLSLDSFYQVIRKLEPTTLVAQTEKDEDSTRFGYALQIVYGGQRHAVSDLGNQFIRLEADYNRLMEIIATIQEFIGRGIHDQAFEVSAQLVLDVNAIRPDSMRVELEQVSLIDLGANDRPGDTLLGGFTALLSGKYQVTAWAKVADSAWTWKKEIILNQPTTVQLVLGKDGFRENLQLGEAKEGTPSKQ